MTEDRLQEMTAYAPQPIHPFPARMAPSIALAEVQSLAAGSIVLDPMMGSGTVVRVAAQHGHYAIGRDLDPLAVLMTRVWTTSIDSQLFLDAATNLVHEAQRLNGEPPTLPWIDEDPETRAYVDYWFDTPQQDALRRLSSLLYPIHSAEGDALRIALSKIIVTKDRGASLARDVPHSRPHRAFEHTTYDVYAGFLQSVQRLVKRFDQEPALGDSDVDQGDARQLSLHDGSVDAVITSPPYLNAIDYLRGHRLTLVWLGHQLSSLRTIRGESIGTERAPGADTDTALAAKVIQRMQLVDRLPQREHRMVERYILDLSALLSEMRRVLRPGGRAVFVLGNSCIRGVFVKNSLAVSTLAQQLGFRQLRRRERDLPPSRRYMPPPTAGQDTGMERRMRTEIVLTYERQ